MGKEFKQEQRLAIIPGAEQFYLEGCRGEAVLLLHGYTGAPSEMRPLGEFLQGNGYTVSCPRLPGHGTTVENCEQSSAEEWYQEALVACQKLLKDFAVVHVVGLSMGGLLAIKIAASLPVKTAAFLAPAIQLQDKRILLYPILKYFIRYLPKLKKPLGEMAQYNITYKKMPTRPLESLFKLQDECRNRLLKKIQIPVLIIQSKIEKTVDPLGAQKIYDSISTPEHYKKLIWLEKCGHILTLDKEYEKVFEEILQFLEKHHE